MSNKPQKGRNYQGHCPEDNSWSDPLCDELRGAIRHMVANISKSFIVEWYTSISPTNHDFVASCETLIEEALTKLAELCSTKLDSYKIGQLVTSLLHDHILNDNVAEKIQSIRSQINEHEYDICQNSVVRLFGLLCTEELRRVIFTRASIPANLEPREDPRNSSASQKNDRDNASDSTEIKTTSALYTLVIAMLTKAVFMPIVNSISEPNWLYAVIIWLCKKEERDRAKSKELARNHSAGSSKCNSINPQPSKICPDRRPTSITVTNTRGFRSLDLEEGIDIASASINFENPVCDSLKRPLDNIEIYATEEVKSNNSCYVLYCIRYDGLCHRHPSAGFSFIPENHELPIIDKRATNISHKRLILDQPSTSCVVNRSDTSNRKSYRRSMTIKRRFREFVILQLRLEENPKIRPYMKNIPKPTKLKAATQNIFSLPGLTNIKLDQSTIKLRQRFLERFLIALNSSPFIANSYEFKEFFSYNVHSAGINISKSKSLILQVNLNKVFVDSVRSALSIIRSTLPGDDYQHLGSNPDPDAWLIELQQSTMKLHVQSRTSHSKMNLERYIDTKLLSMNTSPSRFSNNGHRTVATHMDEYRATLRANLVKSNSNSSHTSSSPPMLSRSSSSNSRIVDSSSRTSSTETVYYDASNVLINEQKKCDSIDICDSVPIASRLIDIMHYSISRDSSCSNSSINFIARILLGKTIEKCAYRLLEAAFTLKTATFCINGITSSIWDESDDPPLDLESASLDEAVLHLTNLVMQNYANHYLIPKQPLRTLISKQIGFYLSQLSSKERNKFVIYSFFVHLLDELEAV